MTRQEWDGETMELNTLTEQGRHWATAQPDKVWMYDLHEGGFNEYAWGPTIAEIDRAAAWLEKEFGTGQRMALLSRNRLLQAKFQKALPLSLPSPPQPITHSCRSRELPRWYRPHSCGAMLSVARHRWSATWRKYSRSSATSESASTASSKALARAVGMSWKGECVPIVIAK